MEHPPLSQCSYMGKTAPESISEKFELPPGCEMSVRLRKDQIDKASKDTSGRFAAEFATWARRHVAIVKRFAFITYTTYPNKDKWGLALDGQLKHKITSANYKFYPRR